MIVTSTTSTPTTSYSDVSLASSVAARAPRKALGQEDFLKLLATQFKAQDPLKPMEDTAFIAQMAQFSSLEQTSSMVREMTLLRADQNLLTAGSYLGRKVTVNDEEGKPVSGVVTSVNHDPATGVTLTIGDQPYPLASVRRIEPVVVPINHSMPESPDLPAA
jgi:flagellar basal-body rod modification protein FlgD